ncbi:MAG: hypothetical protein WC525_10430 [Candidatus Thermoplasmatota archaeon]
MALIPTFFFSSLITLAIAHGIATAFFLYWKYIWLDVPMHLLGGITVVLGIASLPSFHITLLKRHETLVTSIVAVLIVGILWELFEVATGVPFTRESYVFDTSLDLLMDVFGGAVGYGIVKGIHES